MICCHIVRIGRGGTDRLEKYEIIMLSTVHRRRKANQIETGAHLYTHGGVVYLSAPSSKKFKKMFLLLLLLLYNLTPFLSLSRARFICPCVPNLPCYGPAKERKKKRRGITMATAKGREGYRHTHTHGAAFVYCHVKCCPSCCY